MVDASVPVGEAHDADGQHVGTSAPGILADAVHFSDDGEQVGESWGGLFGQERHYGSDGELLGESWDGLVEGTDTSLE